MDCPNHNGTDAEPRRSAARTAPVSTAAALRAIETSPSTAVSILRAAGARLIAETENRQPDARLAIASVHHAGITGIGPGLIGAARDWTRQAREARP